MTEIERGSRPACATWVFPARVSVLLVTVLASARSAESAPVAAAPAREAMQAQAPADSRLNVLFLGDDGHHRPADRAKSVLPVLADNGIDLFYTDDPADLDPAVLDRYHALVFYNNQPTISPSEMAALTGFLENGGGLVVLHCASASFQNSDAFIRLVGAAFKSHGTGTFGVTRLRPDHPVLRGVPEFESWDETYIHTKHNPDRTVLAVRSLNGHDEPWTWVRNYGDGRIFYTAWGHDERTWGKKGFQQLLAQAIKWTAGDWALTMKAAERIPQVTRLEVPLPLYEPPPAPWNTMAGFVDSAQVALPPEQSYARMTVRPGFRVEPFAAEPLIGNIIDFTWDERGRLWAVETEDYPNTVLPVGEPGNDRILILEDTDGDGRADETKVFADGLNLATSLVFANGGLIVGQAPHMLFFRDTDGDDRADERRILFTGWPRDDTHGVISNLRYGLDNQVWGSVGYNGFRGTVGGVTFGRGDGEIYMGAGYFRFAPDGSSLDYVARTSNNTWGVGFSEEGYVFGSTANDNASNFIHIPGRYYRELIGRTPTLSTIADRQDVYPLRTIYQVDQFGMYTAGAAHEVYTARAYPREYWNRVAFVAEPTAHVIGMFELIPDGSTFRAENAWSLMASRDAWQAPVQVKVGPDGAVWVSDFYSLVAQHNPTPEGMERGEGNAYITPNRDKSAHGRIYRIVYEDAPSPGTTSLRGATPQELVATLRDDNMFWRLTAQRLLVERGRADVVPALIELLNDQTIDELGLNPGALHALWTLDGLGAIAGNAQARAAARQALHHPAASVRRAALMALPRNEQLLQDIFAAGMLPDRSSPHEVDYTVGSAVLQDADARVRLTALLTLSELPPSTRAANAIVDLIRVPENARDPWMPDAVAIAGVQQGPEVAVALLQSRLAAEDSRYLAGIQRTVQLMTYHFAAQENAAAVVTLLAAVPDANPTVALGVVTGIVGEDDDDDDRDDAGDDGGDDDDGDDGDGDGDGDDDDDDDYDRWRLGGGWPPGSPPELSAEKRAVLVGAARRAPPELAEGFARIAAHWGMADLFTSP